MNPSSRDRAWLKALLCERCGYVLDGLDRAGSCPECGKAIVESLPERRVGTAWQRVASSENLRKTGVEMLRRPGSVFSVMSVRTGLWRRHWGLLVFNCWFASWAWIVLMMLAVAPMIYLLFSVMFAFYGLVALFLLSCVELLGVLFWTRRRGRRINAHVSLAICVHASYGWVYGALVAGVPMAAVLLVMRSMGYASEGGPAEVVLAIAIGLASFIGLVWFETLVYLGMRQCRYANAAD